MRFIWIVCAAAVWAGSMAQGAQEGEGDRPNVLLIIVDDLNDWVGCLGGHPQAHTPHIDRLAARGLLFTNAHCTAPLCNPSRTSFLSGYLPSTSGVLGNDQDWRREPFFEGRDMLPQYFRRHGYWSGGAGKVYHANHGGPTGALTGGHGGRAGFNHPDSWDERFPSKDVQIPMPAVLAGRNFNGLDIWHWDWGPIDAPDERTVDGRTSGWAARQLQREHDRPFFLALGVYRPHPPWYAPRPWFERRPLDRVILPLVREDDVADVPEAAVRYLRNPNHFHKRILDNRLWREAVRAYLANITFADAMIGGVLDALDRGGHADDTIIVLLSDHGWHLGEKQRWHKSTLWEEATRVPLIIVAPGLTRPGTVCTRPVSLVDLYPTLIDLCGLPARDDLDGRSLATLLRDPAAPREVPAVTSQRPWNSDLVHHSVRTERWRYTRYGDGGEELYDHAADPHEWRNLTGHPDFTPVKRELAKWLPQ